MSLYCFESHLSLCILACILHSSEQCGTGGSGDRRSDIRPDPDRISTNREMIYGEQIAETSDHDHQTFQILTGIEKVDIKQFFELRDTGYNPRGHSKRLTVKRCRLDYRKYFFSNRVSIIGITSHKKLLMLGPSTSSRTVWIDTGKIWAFKEWFFSAHHRSSK